MIDKAVFAEGMGQLGGAFGREIDGPVSRMYYAVLSPQLTTEEYTHAVTQTIASERFWPSPAVILEKAGRDAEAKADASFRMVTDALSKHGGYRFLPAEVSQSWDAATWAGIKAIGGLREITECSDQRWQALVKKFHKAHQESTAPALPTGDKVQPQVKQMVAALVRGGQDHALPAGDR